MATCLIASIRESQSVKILLYCVGKARDAHANAMAEEYIKRSTRFATCEMREIQPRADLLLALSPMTMPHELARVVLAEQVYRALTTLRGHPYPR